MSRCCANKMIHKSDEPDAARRHELERLRGVWGCIRQCKNTVSHVLGVGGETYGLCHDHHRVATNNQTGVPTDDFYCNSSGLELGWTFPNHHRTKEHDTIRSLMNAYPERWTHYGPTPDAAFIGWYADAAAPDAVEPGPEMTIDFARRVVADERNQELDEALSSGSEAAYGPATPLKIKINEYLVEKYSGGVLELLIKSPMVACLTKALEDGIACEAKRLMEEEVENKKKEKQHESKKSEL